MIKNANDQLGYDPVYRKTAKVRWREDWGGCGGWDVKREVEWSLEAVHVTALRSCLTLVFGHSSLLLSTQPAKVSKPPTGHPASQHSQRRHTNTILTTFFQPCTTNDDNSLSSNTVLILFISILQHIFR